MTSRHSAYDEQLYIGKYKYILMHCMKYMYRYIISSDLEEQVLRDDFVISPGQASSGEV